MSGTKILITGEPRSGKSTLISSLIKDIPNKQGFITQEVLVETVRTGFSIVSASGEINLFASVDVPTQHKVSKYFVDIEKLNMLIPKLRTYNPDTFLYIDEIGEMELLSEEFKELAQQYIDSKNFFFGTISQIYTDPFITSLRNRTDISHYEITHENRVEILNSIRAQLDL